MASSGSLTTEQLDRLKSTLFEFVKKAAHETGMPYASLLIDRASGVIVARDYNTSLLTFDPSDQCAVAAIRKAQRALETRDLSHLALFSFFEPTLLAFDIALFAGITEFAWCIDTATAPPGHYSITDYTPTIYAHEHPEDIAIMPSYHQDEALQLLATLPLHVPKGSRLGGWDQHGS